MDNNNLTGQELPITPDLNQQINHQTDLGQTPNINNKPLFSNKSLKLLFILLGSLTVALIILVIILIVYINKNKDTSHTNTNNTSSSINGISDIDKAKLESQGYTDQQIIVQLQNARNATRRSNVESLLQAIRLYNVDNNGYYPSGLPVLDTGDLAKVNSELVPNCKPANPNSKVNCLALTTDGSLSSVIVQKYLQSMPQDIKFNSSGKQLETPYYIGQTSDGGVIIFSVNMEKTANNQGSVYYLANTNSAYINDNISTSSISDVSPTFTQSSGSNVSADRDEVRKAVLDDLEASTEKYFGTYNSYPKGFTVNGNTITLWQNVTSNNGTLNGTGNSLQLDESDTNSLSLKINPSVIDTKQSCNIKETNINEVNICYNTDGNNISLNPRLESGAVSADCYQNGDQNLACF